MNNSARDKARKLFLEGYNCAQSVFAACAEELGIGKETALRLSAPMGAGVGRMREVCGAFSACAMLAGLKFADTSPSPESKKRIYEITQTLAEEFKRRNGSIICRELLKLNAELGNDPTPDLRDAKYYASRPCLKIVELAAEIAEFEILAEGGAASKKS